MFSRYSIDDILKILDSIKVEGDFFDLSEVEFNPEDEKLLIHRVLMGDGEAFANIVRAHQQMVFNLAFRLMGNREEAEDLTQEVFFRVYRYLKKFKGKSTLKTWIYRITVNSSFNRSSWLRRRHHGSQKSLECDPETSEKPLKDKLQGNNPNPEKSTLNSELQSEIQTSLRSLPIRLRMAVVLRDIEGLSYVEIAEAMKVNVGTVKSRIARGRAAMRELLKEYVEQ